MNNKTLIKVVNLWAKLYVPSLLIYIFCEEQKSDYSSILLLLVFYWIRKVLWVWNRMTESKWLLGKIYMCEIPIDMVNMSNT